MENQGLVALEICAGAGGQALGVERAGFQTAAAIEWDADACATLRQNRPGWDVIQGDIRSIDGRRFRGIDLLAGGVPCPPFSIAGQQRGSDDERDLFPSALRLIGESKPKAVMLENVRGLSTSRFLDYRERLLSALKDLGYHADWRVLHASDFGVPQLRPRFVLVALPKADWRYFQWPRPSQKEAPTVGEALSDLMASRGWLGAKEWALRANDIAPTLVGGSKKHGGPDLGPTRARLQWAKLGVNGKSLAEEAPEATDPVGILPRLTVRMAARIQGFPDSWAFVGRKTQAYRQVGNAFPPPVARAVARALGAALSKKNSVERNEVPEIACG